MSLSAGLEIHVNTLSGVTKFGITTMAEGVCGIADYVGFYIQGEYIVFPKKKTIIICLGLMDSKTIGLIPLIAGLDVHFFNVIIKGGIGYGKFIEYFIAALCILL